VDQGRAFTAGYWDDANMVIADDKPLIIFGDHTREIKWIDFPFIPGADGVQVLKPHPEMDPRFLYFFLRNLPIESRGYARHFKNVKDAEYLVPPIAEQTRIAAKLDELLAQVDTLKARIDGIPALLKRFRQSVLTAAVSGRLTEEWRLKTASCEASSEMQLGDESLVVPASWKKTRLGDVTKKDRRLCYGVIQPGPEVDKGVDLIRVCDIKDGTIDWGRLRKIDNGIDAEYSRSRVREGDIVVSIVGTIGRAAIVRENRNANIARAVALISVDQELVLPSWAYIWLTAPVSQWWLTSSSKEVARKTLNLKELIEMPVPRPSIAEQTEIVRRVEQLFAFADQLEARVKAAQARIDRLTQSILAKAFRGELVPQDPNDEPASVLLERIKAQRAAVPKARRGRRAATLS